MVKNLLTKHKVFIFEWLKEPTCVFSAMVRAGYKGQKSTLETRAYEILNHPEAMAITGPALNDPEIKAKVKLTVESVLEDIEEAKAYARETYYDAQGNKRRELSVFLKAIELQGKHLKMFAERVSIETDSHAELVLMIKQRMGQTDG